MQIININNNTYYLCTDLFKKFNDIFSNCKGRDVIKKKKLKENEYIYAYETNSGWKVSKEDYSKAKVLISTKWKGLPLVSQTKSNTTNFLNVIETTNTSVLYNESIVDYPIAPDIIEIEENDLQRPKFNINIFLLRLKFKS